MSKNKLISYFLLIACLLYFNTDFYFYYSRIVDQLGRYIYNLDDTYIHMAIAKNFAEHGVWGPTRYEYASASSSPLHTFLISLLFKIFGRDELIPLYLNLFFANLLIITFFFLLRKSPLKLLIFYIFLLFAVMLKVLVSTGMEHVMHIFFISTFWFWFIKLYLSDYTDNSAYWGCMLSAPFLILSRYESIFLLTLVFVVLVFRSLNIKTFILLVLTLTPFFTFGFLSLSQDGFFFPNSVLAKGNSISSFGELIVGFLYGLGEIFTSIHFFSFFATATLFYEKNFSADLSISRATFSHTLPLILFLVALFGHLTFAWTGTLYRYDAYLVALFVVSFLFYLDDLPMQQLGKLNSNYYLLLIFLPSMIYRTIQSEDLLNYVNKNIYDQQIQMAYFLKKYMNDATIMANDIGAISYYTDIKLIDLVGLASTDVLRSRLKYHKTGVIDELNKTINSKKYDLIMMYDSWFSDTSPIPITILNKEKIAELSIKNNRICGDYFVSFYVSKSSSKKQKILQDLEKFKSEIPKDVTLKIFKG